jgi:hypothetical protein
MVCYVTGDRHLRDHPVRVVNATPGSAIDAKVFPHAALELALDPAAVV